MIVKLLHLYTACCGVVELTPSPSHSQAFVSQRLSSCRPVSCRRGSKGESGYRRCRRRELRVFSPTILILIPTKIPTRDRARVLSQLQFRSAHVTTRRRQRVHRWSTICPPPSPDSPPDTVRLAPGGACTFSARGQGPFGPFSGRRNPNARILKTKKNHTVFAVEISENSHRVCLKWVNSM